MPPTGRGEPTWAARIPAEPLIPQPLGLHVSMSLLGGNQT